MSAAEVARFLGLTPASSHLCRNLRWFGSRGDGGYHVCVDQLVPGSCVVYSLGTRENPSFDLAMGKFGCEVHSFDPSLQQQGLDTATKLGKRSTNVTFHDVGIGGQSRIYEPGTAPWQWPGLRYGREANSGRWTLRTLESLMRELGHNHVDVLKMGEPRCLLAPSTSNTSRLHTRSRACPMSSCVYVWRRRGRSRVAAP